MEARLRGLGAAACAFGAALVAGCAPAAPDEAGAGDRPPVVFTATDFAYEGPTSIPAGMTEIELVNRGASHHGLTLVELHDGKTADDVLAVLEDLSALPDWITFAGGVGGIPPGARGRVVHDLTPGDYVAFSFESAEGSEVPDAARGMIQSFAVTEADGTAAAVPEADATLTLHDFRFDLTGELERGWQTIEVRNEGTEAHEALLMKLSEGVAAEDVVGMITSFASGGPPEGESVGDGEGQGDDESAAGGPPEGPPFASAGGLPPIDPGETAHLSLELEPGNYVLLCFIPSAASEGTMHMAMGMHHAFTVE